MIPSNLIGSLAMTADAAIDAALLSGAPGQKTPTSEVGFVAAIVLGAVPDIATAWHPILHPHGYSALLTGVFCHQTPQASFTDSSGNPQTCELADLMIVVDDITSGAAKRRWAALIQAKMAKANGGKTLSKIKDLAQLDLMTRFPPFRLLPGYAPGFRDFATCLYLGTTADCGWYGLISKRPSREWHQQVPAKSMPAGGRKLGSFIAKMVEAGQVGFGREATGVSDDWSRTVNELLMVTRSQVFNYAAGFSRSQPKQIHKIAFTATFRWPDDQAYGFLHLPADLLPTGGKPRRLDEAEGPEGGGISIIHIEIGRSEKG